MIKSITVILLISFSSISYGDCNTLHIRRSLNHTEHGFTKEKEIVKSGNFSQRFELRHNECGYYNKGWNDCNTDRSRSEVTVLKDIPVNSTRFIRYNLYLPEDFETSKYVRTTLGQVHQRGGPVRTVGGYPSMPPLLQFNARGKNYNLCWHTKINEKISCKTYKIMSISDLKGKWTEILIELNTSPKNGYAKIFVNGELKVSIDEPLFEHIPKEFYFKYGIYNSFVSRNKGPMPTQVVYYDEVQIVNSKDKLCKKYLD